MLWVVLKMPGGLESSHFKSGGCDRSSSLSLPTFSHPFQVSRMSCKDMRNLRPSQKKAPVLWIERLEVQFGQTMESGNNMKQRQPVCQASWGYTITRNHKRLDSTLCALKTTKRPRDQALSLEVDPMIVGYAVRTSKAGLRKVVQSRPTHKSFCAGALNGLPMICFDSFATVFCGRN